MKEKTDLNYAIATNSNGIAVLIPFRRGRGKPTRMRNITGAVMWSAEDGQSETLGIGMSLPVALVNELHAGRSVPVFEVNSDGVPVSDFLLNLSEFTQPAAVATASH